MMNMEAITKNSHHLCHRNTSFHSARILLTRTTKAVTSQPAHNKLLTPRNLHLPRRHLRDLRAAHKMGDQNLVMTYGVISPSRLTCLLHSKCAHLLLRHCHMQIGNRKAPRAFRRGKVAWVKARHHVHRMWVTLSFPLILPHRRLKRTQLLLPPHLIRQKHCHSLDRLISTDGWLRSRRKSAGRWTQHVHLWTHCSVPHSV